ncbi:hypothetical protein GFD17_01440 [Bifidobacterium sp. SMB2]|uniref:Alginate lyase domain-containing protein n=1 Tax=Bifidobacterium saimiriisciurei TaxID=2661627 RepID=A0ABX0CH65_9BIFI|nr:MULTISPECIES: hypothetical protein [Bifidobacterium]NEG95439.1 hypothetical protein [Bifidobacterium sp. SMB2]NEH12204.1 hypothetical protein [Bifidobacterium saimiriisciurei]
MPSRSIIRSLMAAIVGLAVLLAGLLIPGSAASADESVTVPGITDYVPQAEDSTNTVSFTDPTDSVGKTVTFHHPGVIMNADYLNAMRDGVRAGKEPWLSAYKAYSSYAFARKNPRVYYESCFVNVLGPWKTDYCGKKSIDPQDYFAMRFQWDGDTAFKQAVMWYITGDNTYRATALNIIRKYASVEFVQGTYSFRLGVASANLAMAAEIMRATDPAPAADGSAADDSLIWNDDDTARFTKALDMYEPAFGFQQRRFHNQEQFCLAGLLAKAVWENDGESYARAVKRIVGGGADDISADNGTGSINYQMKWMTENELTGEALPESEQHVQVAEMGRDAGHARDDIGGLTTLAQAIYVQGTKVDARTGVVSNAKDAVTPFEFGDDRLLAGVDYYVKYHTGVAVTWTPQREFSFNRDGVTVSENRNVSNDGDVTVYLGVLYNYYKSVRKVDMTGEAYRYLAEAYERAMPEGLDVGASGRNWPAAGTLLWTLPEGGDGSGSGGEGSGGEGETPDPEPSQKPDPSPEPNDKPSDKPGTQPSQQGNGSGISTGSGSATDADGNGGGSQYGGNEQSGKSGSNAGRLGRTGAAVGAVVLAAVVLAGVGVALCKRRA